MNTQLSYQALRQQNSRFRNTGGVSKENRDRGFKPAFHDRQSQRTELARFRDGRPAPCHLLEGLPVDWVEKRTTSGTVLAVRSSIVAGFVRDGQFYTRQEAANLCCH